MKKNTLLGILAIIVVFIAGCELATNPLVFDSSIRTDGFKINVPSGMPASTLEKSVDLGELRDVVDKDIESIRFYNMTLMIENNKYPNATISGSLKINGTTLLTLNNVHTNIFHIEKSIFDTSGTNMQIDNAGLTLLVNAIKANPPGTVSMKAELQPLSEALDFTLWIKIYGQITAKP